MAVKQYSEASNPSKFKFFVEDFLEFGKPKRIEEKIEDYRKFWNLAEVQKPIIGFDFIGFFPSLTA
jgi:hypothetical protein